MWRHAANTEHEIRQAVGIFFGKRFLLNAPIITNFKLLSHAVKAGVATAAQSIPPGRQDGGLQRIAPSCRDAKFPHRQSGSGTTGVGPPPDSIRSPARGTPAGVRAR